jgi:hypothetical protein
MLDTSRVIDPTDFSVSPSRDTGFRMASPILTTPYKNPGIKAYKDVPIIDCIHNDDMVDIGPGLLNGQPISPRSVRLYRIDFKKALHRANYWTARGLSDKAGETCLCDTPFGKGWPWSVPCCDCGVVC